MYKLSGPKWGPLACWMTGWLNLLGQIASLASVNFTVANLISTIVLLAFEHQTTQFQVRLMYCLCWLREARCRDAVPSHLLAPSPFPL